MAFIPGMSTSLLMGWIQTWEFFFPFPEVSCEDNLSNANQCNASFVETIALGEERAASNHLSGVLRNGGHL